MSPLALVRRTGTALLGVVAATTLAIVASAAPGAALDCAEPDLAESLATADVAFIGEQIDETADRIQTFRIDRWLADGEPLATVAMERDEDWGTSYLDRGIRVFIGYRGSDGRIRTALCGNAWDPFEAQLVIDGLPTPTAEGAPAFVAATTRIDGVVGVVLDDAGEVLHYAPGDERLHTFAPCPGGEFVAAVRSQPSDDFGSIPVDSPWWIDVRRTSDLGLESTVRVDPVSPVNDGSLGVVDLRCHADDGSLLTALAPVWGHDGVGSRDVRRGGDVLTVRGETVERLPVEWPRSVAYDSSTDTVHVIADERGRAVSSFSPDGTTTVTELPEGHAGWHLVVDDGTWRVVTGDRRVDESNLHAGIVSHVLTGTPGDFTETPLPLGSGHATVTGLHRTTSGVLAHIADGTEVAILVDLMDPDDWNRIGTEWFQGIAIGDAVTLVDRVGTAGLAVLSVDGPVPLVGLLGGQAATAIRPATGTVDEIVARSSAPTSELSLSPRYPTIGVGPPATTTPQGETPDDDAALGAPPATAPSPDDGGSTGLLIGVIAVLGLVISVFIIGRKTTPG